MIVSPNIRFTQASSKRFTRSMMRGRRMKRIIHGYVTRSQRLHVSVAQHSRGRIAVV